MSRRFVMTVPKRLCSPNLPMQRRRPFATSSTTSTTIALELNAARRRVEILTCTTHSSEKNVRPFVRSVASKPTPISDVAIVLPTITTFARAATHYCQSASAIWFPFAIAATRLRRRATRTCFGARRDFAERHTTHLAASGASRLT